VGIEVMKFVLAVPLVLVLTACDRSIDDLEEQRANWRANAPPNYAYTIQLAGWRSPRDLLHPKRVTVSEAGTSAVYVWHSGEHEIGETALAGTYWSMDRVFDELVEAKRRSAYVRARFDDRGFVERAFVDYRIDASGWDIEIREFEDLTRGDRRH
jgi:hypothetical protein